MAKTKHLEKGMKFGLWTTLGEHKQILKGTRLRWYEKCICECGTERRVNKCHLKEGTTTNCGCKKVSDFVKRNTTHGDTKNRLYRIYNCIVRRCNDPKNSRYNIYGGRGIKCMRGSYEDFKRDMGDSYYEHEKKYGEKNTTIDRINVDGDYCKENCRWATVKEQSFNKRNNRREMWNGKMMSISEIYEIANPVVTYTAFQSRYYRLKRPLRDCLYRLPGTKTNDVLNDKYINYVWTNV